MYRQRLGDAVREARMNLDLSQNTLAERSHVPFVQFQISKLIRRTLVLTVSAPWRPI